MGMDILVRGGSGLIGPHLIRNAIERAHTITVFNRGQSRPGELPEGVEQLIGDRGGNLDALRGRRWDVCIDIPARLPSWVRGSAAVLKENVGRYVFISTISVFADMSRPNDETSPLAKYDGADPYAETVESLRAKPDMYGPLKAECEREVLREYPGKALIIRPGLIVGPGDETDRFSYWPVRIARGGEVLAPGNPTDAVQWIDARDLAEWTIRMAEQRATGIFNATGPAQPAGMGDMLEGIQSALGADARFTWASTEFLEEQKVAPWSDMPVWLPSTGDDAGMSRTNIDRALAAGLTFRPFEVTVRDTLEWFRSRPAERQTMLKAGLSPEREEQALAAWHSRR
jgi:2'-hydroxyisoflavone reductase